jgi:protein-S-isoprenylcysteine O-methyltransferase Ste14
LAAIGRLIRLAPLFARVGVFRLSDDGLNMSAARGFLRLPPPIWAMVWLALAAALSFALGWPQMPFERAHEPAGIALFFGGWIAPVWAFVTLTRAGTEIDPLSTSNARLVVHGPYRFSRNPMYLGLAVATLGLAIWIGAWPMLAAPILTFAGAARVHVPFEEAKLRRQFGAAYDAYAARVRRWL